MHCDPTVSHYIKVLMDGIFGRKNFKNEIVWKRTSAHNRAKRFGPVHDIILFYTKSRKSTWNRVLQPYDEAYLDKSYRHEDSEGRRYRTSDLTGPGLRDGSSGAAWSGYDPSSVGRHWEPPPDRSLPDWFVFPEGYASMTVQERLDVLNAQGLIHWPKRGKVPEFRRYLETMGGVAAQDVITDIPNEGGSAKYQTKKPGALLERLIRAASNEGDLILDPSADAERGRDRPRAWPAVDWDRHQRPAVDEIEDRLRKHGQYRGQHYDILEGNPETMDEYKRLNPYDKQDWLIRRLNGLPNPASLGTRR